MDNVHLRIEGSRISRMLLIHLLRDRLDTVDQAPRHESHRNEDPAHDPEQRAEEDEPVLPRLNVPHGDGREVVAYEQAREHRRVLRRQHLGLDDVPRHGRLVRLPLGVERPLVRRGDELDRHVRQSHAALVVHHVRDGVQGVLARREGLAERHVVYVVGDVGQAAVEGVDGVPPRRVDVEHEEGRRVPPGGRADRHGQRPPDALDVDRSRYGAALALLLVRRHRAATRRDPVLLRRGLPPGEGERRLVVLLKVPGAVRGAVVAVVRGLALDVREGHVHPKGYAMAKQVLRPGLVEEERRDRVGELHVLPRFDLQVDRDLGDEEYARRERRKEGYEAARHRALTDALDGLDEGVVGSRDHLPLSCIPPGLRGRDPASSSLPNASPIQPSRRIPSAGPAGAHAIHTEKQPRKPEKTEKHTFNKAARSRVSHSTSRACAVLEHTEDHNAPSVDL
ncbi:hypothetical protein THAOC_28070 [Thalassiosira oceanica]|uniref:Uncharacterized protein n=1 Tax=Thalassiosira oceanica TaxID=159749 RepID=K0RHE0_THAOC|nr:hypothetical protein THAOC_28070 [Thalassiosira oceanica]|eukprot:EJK52645.1 hypothetical protein THAOC_28070 [Thalassiosira oceanica]